MELESLEELTITPNTRYSKYTKNSSIVMPDILHEKHVSFPLNDHDSEEDSGDEGEALLVSGERPPLIAGDVRACLAEQVGSWVQARRIAVEVISPSFLTIKRFPFNPGAF
jgi:solute carrier family 41